MADKNMEAQISVEFEEASSRQSLNSGETINTLWGKVKRWLSDLKTVCFSGSYNDLSNTPTIPTKVSELENDSGFKTTDNDTLPYQYNTATDGEYRLLLSYQANDNSYREDYLRKSGKFTANPSTGTLSATTFKGDLDGDAATVNGHAVEKDVPADAVFTDTIYNLPTAGLDTLGGVKTSSSVTSSSGYTACPIISGVPYYKDTNTTYTLSSLGVTMSKSSASGGSDGNIHFQYS